MLVEALGVARDGLVEAVISDKKFGARYKEGRILLSTRLCRSWHGLNSSERWLDPRKILLYNIAVAFGGGHV